MLITLSGLDGAGKSTLAKALKASLEKNGVPATIAHMNKDVGLYACLRSVCNAIKRLFGAVSAPRPDGKPAIASSQEMSRTKAALLALRRRIIWNKALRRWVDVGDLLTFLLYRLYVERIRGRALIMDRYFYDRLADQADGRRWSYLRWFARMTPLPDVPVMVEVSPEQAFERKGEFSIAAMTLRNGYYREIFSWVPTSVILCNNELDVAAGALDRLVVSRMNGVRPQKLAA